MKRRDFLLGLGATVLATAVPVGGTCELTQTANRLFSPDMIAREALRMLHQRAHFVRMSGRSVAVLNPKATLKIRARGESLS
jgi:hypothetical protein